MFCGSRLSSGVRDSGVMNLFGQGDGCWLCKWANYLIGGDAVQSELTRTLGMNEYIFV